jgi:hypothetical protein
MCRLTLQILPVFALAFVTALPVTASAQTASGLAGTWVLDADKSDPAAIPAGRGGGRGFGRGGGLPPDQLRIVEGAGTVTVTRGNQEFVYNLDGSETPGPPGGETKSMLTRDGGKLIVTWKREYFAGALGYVTATGRDVYSLEGGMLKVERMTADPRRGEQTITSVYAK